MASRPVILQFKIWVLGSMFLCGSRNDLKMARSCNTGTILGFGVPYFNTCFLKEPL